MSIPYMWLDYVLTITPNTREVVETKALPVPLSFAGNISGDMAYRTPYMICEAHRQPRHWEEEED